MITERLTTNLFLNKLSSYASIEQYLVSSFTSLPSSKGTKRDYSRAYDLISGCGFWSKNFCVLRAQSCSLFSKILATPLFIYYVIYMYILFDTVNIKVLFLFQHSASKSGGFTYHEKTPTISGTVMNPSQIMELSKIASAKTCPIFSVGL